MNSTAESVNIKIPKPVKNIPNEERAIGEWVYQEFATHIVIETEGWAFDLVQQVAKRLNHQRVASEPLEPVVIWIPQVTAFIVPGCYVYVARELLERPLSEEAVALVVAHEFAHHDLGHVKLFHPALSMIKHLPGSSYTAVTLRAIERLFFSPEQELEADKYGLELCLPAEYDQHRCLELFDLLETHLLDYGDLDGVFGLEDPESVSPIPYRGLGRWFRQAKTWMEERIRRYPALRTRKEALLARL